MRLILPLLLACGCADGELTVVDAATDGLTLDAVSERTDGAPPRRDGSPPSPPPASCTPGQRVSVCGVCDADGQPALAMDDPECAPVDCTALERYELRQEDPATVCVRLRYETAPGTCADLGVCRTPQSPGACAGPTPTETARVEAECETITGCAGPTPPSPVDAPAGTPCGGGTCDGAGECELEVVDGCENFAGYNVCESGVHVDGTPYCDLDVEPPDGGSCADACREASNVLCLLAWQIGDEICQQGMPVGCLDRGEHLLCRCAR